MNHEHLQPLDSSAHAWMQDIKYPEEIRLEHCERLLRKIAALDGLGPGLRLVKEPCLPPWQGSRDP